MKNNLKNGEKKEQGYKTDKASTFPAEITGDVIAISDIHSNYYALLELWGILETQIQDFESKWVVFLGDYMDRGNYPIKTLNFLIKLWKTRPKTTFLCGNHDFAISMFLKLFDEPKNFDFNKIAAVYHKQHTLSKGKEFDHMHLQGLRYSSVYESEKTFKAFAVEQGNQIGLSQKFPEKFKEFYRKLPWVIEHPDYLFVHAGMPSYIPWNESISMLKLRDLRLDRPPWMCSRHLKIAPEFAEKMIISGHYHVEKIIFNKNHILIDTSGGHNKHISAIWLPEMKTFTI